MEKIRIICFGVIFSTFVTGMVLALGRLLEPPFWGLSKIKIVVIAGGIFVAFFTVYSLGSLVDYRLVRDMGKATRNQL